MSTFLIITVSEGHGSATEISVYIVTIFYNVSFCKLQLIHENLRTIKI